jgi:SAM-dependent methyltransferase
MWSDLDAEQLELLVYALLEFVREETRRVPPPRGMPFFGLDHAAGELSPYEGLAARGIFRKYESVLLLGAGLGAAARWCHTSFGCEITGIEAAGAVSRGAAALSARARLSTHTQFVAAARSDLPLRPRIFTHVWGVEGWADVAPGDARLREIFRVVRLGGLVALQQSSPGADWEERAREALRSVGLAEPRTAVVERPPLRESVRRARERFLQALRGVPHPLAVATSEALARVYAAWPVAGGPVAQVVGRRPS